jgi:hypothetical protein
MQGKRPSYKEFATPPTVPRSTGSIGDAEGVGNGYVLFRSALSISCSGQVQLEPSTEVVHACVP